jgi:acetyltransferase
MDKHYLSTLLAPESIVVFRTARPTTANPRRTSAHALHARRCAAALTAATLRFLDIHTSGTLGDLAQARADLAIIALPPPDVAARCDWRGAWPAVGAVISSGIGADSQPSCSACARARHAAARAEQPGLPAPAAAAERERARAAGARRLARAGRRNRAR